VRAAILTVLGDLSIVGGADIAAILKGLDGRLTRPAG